MSRQIGRLVPLAATAAVALSFAAPVSAQSIRPETGAGHIASALVAPSAAWHEESTGESPTKAVNAGMVFDTSRAETILFGGHSGFAGLRSDETWTWDGSTWTELHPAKSPSARYGHAMAYDPVRDEVVLFGGAASGYRADTWVFQDGTWKRHRPETAPPRLYRAAMAFDPHLQQVVLFGGYDRSQRSLSDATWTWDGSTWTQLDPASSPSPRSRTELAYDPTRDALVLFGGALGLNGTDPADDTWVWDGTTWTRETPTRAPSPRLLHGIATLGQHVVLFGGTDDEFGGRETNDTWVLRADTWRRLRLDPAPSRRQDPNLAWDPVRGEAMLYGGTRIGPGLQDTWILTP